MKDLDDNQKLALLTESLLLEAKDRFLDALWNTKAWTEWMAERPELAEKKKEHWSKLIQMAKDFLKKYPNWSKELDWNNLESITPVALNDFVASCNRRERALKSRKDYSREGMFADKDARRFNFIGKYRNWVAVQPLNWAACQYLSDFSVGGVPGKWCISMGKSSYWWDKYTNSGDRFVCLIDTVKRSSSVRKVMVQIRGTDTEDGWVEEGTYPTVWTWEDHDIDQWNGGVREYDNWLAMYLQPWDLQDLRELGERTKEPEMHRDGSGQIIDGYETEFEDPNYTPFDPDDEGGVFVPRAE